jgi:hypothetical protein
VKPVRRRRGLLTPAPHRPATDPPQLRDRRLSHVLERLDGGDRPADRGARRYGPGVGGRRPAAAVSGKARRARPVAEHRSVRAAHIAGFPDADSGNRSESPAAAMSRPEAADRVRYDTVTAGRHFNDVPPRTLERAGRSASCNRIVATASPAFKSSWRRPTSQSSSG